MAGHAGRELGPAEPRPRLTCAHVPLSRRPSHAGHRGGAPRHMPERWMEGRWVMHGWVNEWIHEVTQRLGTKPDKGSKQRKF